MNRRDFLATSAAGAALAVHAAEPAAKPLRVGLIGCGWYGKCDLFRLLQVAPVEVVALCDVDQRMLSEASDRIGERKGFTKKPRLHGDYRDLLKERDCDVVIVDTPDHWHALAAIAAMKSGADVWVQKPISVDVMEGKAMVDAARSLGRVVQVGMQRRSTPHLIEARDRVIAAGKLGKVGLVETCCYYHMRAGDVNPPVVKVPDYFDYEMWTGPAPLRPYDAPKNPKAWNEHLPHRRWWRAFMEYGNGITGDMCVHMLDMVRWMLDLGWPTTVGATGGILVQKSAKSNVADTQAAAFDFGDTKVLWQHRTYGAPADPEYPWAAIFYGDKGTLKASVHKYEFLPTDKKAKPIRGEAVIETDKYPVDKDEPDLEQHVASALRGHWRDFLARRADRGRPVSDIEQGHISTASCILANMSMQLKRSLAWDAAKHEVVGDAEATKLLKRDYRAPWSHPAAG